MFRRFHVFVANQIQQIRTCTEPSYWSYIASDQNPADHASRGLTVKELIKSNWLTGLSFLWQKKLPKEDIMVGEVDEGNPELKMAQVFTTKAEKGISQNSLFDHLKGFSDWKRAVKAIARLKHCARSVKGLIERSTDATTLKERKDAEQFIICAVQQEV